MAVFCTFETGADEIIIFCKIQQKGKQYDYWRLCFFEDSNIRDDLAS